MKSIIGLIARVPKRKPRSQSQSRVEQHEEFGYTPVSTPKNLATDYTDDEMLRHEMSSPESMAHREQDFDYEVIDAASPNYDDNDDTETPVSVADHYKGTPPLKSKKKKSRYSHEIPADYQI